MLFIDWCDIEENKERGEKLLKEIRLVDTKGKKYKLEQITHGSHLKMLWECEECNHQWYATVYGRIDGRNCPECYNKNRSEFVRKTKTNSENSLSTWCLNNERGKQIKSEWTGLCEDDKHYTMDEVSYGSKLKMLWRDEFGHEWWDTINKRTYGRDCPYYNNQTSYAEQYIY